MATKKQSRARVEAKREKFMAEYRRAGLEAQAKDRARREEELWELWKKTHAKKHSWKYRDPNCPICAAEKKKAISKENK